ncbi:MAG: class A beta-lactamase-related serine hydrolase [Sphingobacteriales bacterium]|nr:MAG: class A beta-lactamase-related serine hydrolase [Sphingobacteriales bacterium]
MHNACLKQVSNQFISTKHMNIVKLWAGVYLLLLSATGLFAQQKIDTYIDHLSQHRKFMGSVSILFKDSIIYSKSVGYADVARRQENDATTKFRVASISKTFTAVLVLQAIEAGKLGLKDKLSQYFPEIKNADKITIEQLLQHRSGLFNFTDNPDRNDWESRFHTEKESIAHIVKAPSRFEPGTDFEYSNSNYLLLGYILERIYRKPFAAILQEKIVDVVGLKHTYFTNETDPGLSEALSYNIQSNYVHNQHINFSNHLSSGGIASTAIEINKFLSALFGGRLISKESLALMLPEDKGAYGMGMFKLTFSKPEGFEHSGRAGNYISAYWYFPAENLGIVSLANAINIDIEAINTALLQFAYGNTPELPDFNQISGHPGLAFREMMGTYKAKGAKQIATISSDGNMLVLQLSGAGQDYLSFEDKGNNCFEYKDIKLQFLPGKKQMLFEQGKARLLFKKQAG